MRAVEGDRTRLWAMQFWLPDLPNPVPWAVKTL